MRDPTPRLRTERLDLVPLAETDADEMAFVLADPTLYAFIGGEPPDRRALRERFARLAVGHSADGTEEWHNWIARTTGDGVAVGTVQATIHAGPRSAEIAWVIDVPWQRHGYASEAAVALVAWLAQLGVATIVAHVHPDHAASAAVAARAGLVATDEIHDGERLWRLEIASS
jgi:RimJ/RimL family protein N-acetyltransferase